MAVKYRVSATIGEYTDREGNTKKKYVDMGVILTTGNGGLMMKLESIPVGWDGMAWLNEPKDKANPENGNQQQYTDDSDIPF